MRPGDSTAWEKYDGWMPRNPPQPDEDDARDAELDKENNE